MMFEFYYPEANVTQTKILIKHEDYLKIKILVEDDEKEEQRKEKALKELTNNKQWFTDKSPLFEAIFTGILNCNGIFKCQVKQIV